MPSFLISTSGFHYIACSLIDLLQPSNLETSLGMKIFLSGGLDGNTFNYNNSSGFAHYNPKFLAWLAANVIPQNPNDPDIRAAYNYQIGPVVRALYDTHQILFSNPAQWASFLQSYRSAQQKFIAYKNALPPKPELKSYLDPRLTTPPQPFSVINASYRQSIASGHPIQIWNSFTWLGDYAKVVDHDDWYLSEVAGGFWARRTQDGTQKQVYQIVLEILKTFQPQYLKTPTVRPFVPPSNPAVLE